jgi:hypothetical protein
MAIVPGSGPSGDHLPTQLIRASPRFTGGTEVPEDQAADAHRELVASLAPVAVPRSPRLDSPIILVLSSPSTAISPSRPRLWRHAPRLVRQKNLLYVPNRDECRGQGQVKRAKCSLRGRVPLFPG